MSATAGEFATADLFTALLRGEAVGWDAFGMSCAEFVRACNDIFVTGLVDERIRTLREPHGWPGEVRKAIAAEVRVRTAHELLAQNELAVVLEALAAAQVPAILLKGTALAYSVYDAASSRPRVDTDLLIRPDDTQRFRHVMATLGYTAPPYCSGDRLFGQFPIQKTTRSGTVHTFDCHWRISTQSIFADVLTFDEAATRARPLPSLGPHAHALGPVDALLVACIHPVMHHRNSNSILWLFDIHLLASTLSDREFALFAEMAIAKRMACICTHQLVAAQTKLGTVIPDAVLQTLRRCEAHEASATYLQPNRSWLEELIANLCALPRWSHRMQLLREVLFPERAYMLAKHGMAHRTPRLIVVAPLYARRLLSGAWKVATGGK